MKATFRQLQVLESVARNTSFTRAAEELHLTQPAVSMQVKQLEYQLGVVLFEHLGRGIQLSDAGQEMVAYSRRIIELMEEAELTLEELKGLRRGRLKLSVASTANHFATRLLAGFSQRYPGVSFSLDVTNREVLLAQLEHNECDLAIMGQPPETTALIAEPFLGNPLAVIAAADHPLAELTQIPLARVLREHFVLREPGSGTRSALERFLAGRGLALQKGMEMTSNEAIKQAVEAGLGLAVVSVHTLEIELEAGRLAILDVVGFPIRRHWYLAYRSGKRLPPVARAFRELVLNEASQFQRLPPAFME